MLSNLQELKWQEITLEKSASFRRNEISMSCSVDVIHSAGVIGSAFLEFGESRVICAISGPMSMTAINQAASSLSSNIDRCTFDCSVKLAAYLQTNDSGQVEKRFSNYVKEALLSSIQMDLYPKSNFALNCVILQSSTDDLAALINCGSLALADAAVELHDLVTSYSFSSALGIDSIHDKSPFVATFSFMLSRSRICHTNISGRIAGSEILGSIEYCKQACALIRVKMSEALFAKLDKKRA